MSVKRREKDRATQMTKQCECDIMVSTKSGQRNKREAVFRVD